jgi:hypothetical protein
MTIDDSLDRDLGQLTLLDLADETDTGFCGQPGGIDGGMPGL